MPVNGNDPTSEELKSAGLPVMYLDYDGPLHNESVYWDETIRRPQMRAPERYWLFQHTPLLEQLMAPHPAIAIVLSTSWVLHYGLRKAAKELPAGLRSRVVGSIYDGQTSDFRYLPRGAQVASDVERRQPPRWLALDDDAIGWPAWALPHLLLTDPYEGISLPETTLADRVLAGNFIAPYDCPGRPFDESQPVFFAELLTGSETVALPLTSARSFEVFFRCPGRRRRPYRFDVPSTACPSTKMLLLRAEKHESSPHVVCEPCSHCPVSVGGFDP